MHADTHTHTHTHIHTRARARSSVDPIVYVLCAFGSYMVQSVCKYSFTFRSITLHARMNRRSVTGMSDWCSGRKKTKFQPFAVIVCSCEPYTRTTEDVAGLNITDAKRRRK